MRTKEFFLDQFEKLKAQIQKVAATHFNVGYIEYVDLVLYNQWRSQAMALLQQIYPMGTPLSKNLEGFLVGPNKTTEFSARVGIFLAAYEDFRNGMFEDVRKEIEAAVFSDFLSQAEGIIVGVEKCKATSAAVLVGAVLEKSLRTLCMGIEPKIDFLLPDGKYRKMSWMIVELKRRKIISEIEARQLETWTSIRNAAAHGRADEFTLDQVRSMLMGAQDFLGKMMG